MADNLLVAKWLVKESDESASEEVSVQFYKDGSCIVPTALVGIDSDTAPVFLFYQAFENGTIKFEPAETGMSIFFYAVSSEELCLKSMDGREFRFTREAKKPARKMKFAEVIAKPAKDEPVEREPEQHEWKCPKCGKINQNYVGTCGCGELKPKDKPAYNWSEVHPELAVKEEPAPEEPEEKAEEKPEKKAKPKKEEPPERVPEEHEWKCAKCGKINQNYVGTCGCGEPKPKEKPAYNWNEVHPELAVKEEPVAEEPEKPIKEKKEKPKKEEPPERVPEEHEWKCAKCGKINQNYVGTCGCGEPKPKEKPAYNWTEVHPELAVKEEPAPEAPEKPAKEKKEKPKKEAPVPPERVPTENEWKCPKCGKINQNYVGACGCGERKPFPTPPATPKPAQEPAEEPAAEE